MSINRSIKALLARKYLHIEHSAGESRGLILYENGLFSTYDRQVNALCSENFEAMRLRLHYSSLAGDDLAQPFRSDNFLFFHSPGEALQRNFIRRYGMGKDNLRWIGFQHGLIGNSAPSALGGVLSKTCISRYISIEPSFSEALHKYTHVEIMEDLQPLGNFHCIRPQQGECFSIFFDAPDMHDFSANVEHCLLFLQANKCRVSHIQFHPSTNPFVRRRVRSKFLAFMDRHAHASASIFWKSKFKYEHAQLGNRVVTIEADEGLKKMTLKELEPGSFVSTNDHLASVFKKIIGGEQCA